MLVARVRGAETVETDGIVQAKDENSLAILDGAMADIATYFGHQGGAETYRQLTPDERRALVARLRAELQQVR